MLDILSLYHYLLISHISVLAQSDHSPVCMKTAKSWQKTKGLAVEKMMRLS